jgi:hypothetical protein
MRSGIAADLATQQTRILEIMEGVQEMCFSHPAAIFLRILRSPASRNSTVGL